MYDKLTRDDFDEPPSLEVSGGARIRFHERQDWGVIPAMKIEERFEIYYRKISKGMIRICYLGHHGFDSIGQQDAQIL